MKNKLFLILTVLALSACSLQRVDVVKVNPDGSGTFSMAIVLDKEMLQLIQSQSTNGDFIVNYKDACTVKEGTFNTHTDDVYTYADCSLSFAELDSLSMNTGNPTDESVLAVSVKRGLIKDVFTFHYYYPPTKQDTSSPIDVSMIFSYKLTVTLPGRIAATTGTEMDNHNTVTWANVAVTSTADATSDYYHLPSIPFIVCMTAKVLGGHDC